MKQLLTVIGIGAVGLTLACATPAQATDLKGVITLNPTEKGSLKLSGNATAVSTRVRINSSHPESISGGGNAALDCEDIQTVGCTIFTNVTSPVQCGAPATSDPLAALPTPTFNLNNDLGSLSLNSNSVVEPGYYSGGISITGGAVTFNPGVYILDGIGLKISGNSTSVTATKTFFYFRGTGKLSVTGGSIHLTPILIGPHAGMSIFYDRSSTKPCSFSGGSGINVQGMIYMVGGKLSISGSGTVEGDAPVVGSFVVANMVETTGSGFIKVGSVPDIPTPDMQFD
ncbi:MAG: hypothetical protein L0Y44_15855 [Phycisphaerales bacterium]|nr:hypothetical protein [Phycisphaerales bacterium]MCI0632118.1 hypothetical protein [Phycisphaerales bacterium]MCI0676663.1 hypothetical protein [Phycisphaerales bacterium]